MSKNDTSIESSDTKIIIELLKDLGRGIAIIADIVKTPDPTISAKELKKKSRSSKRL